MIEGVHEYVPRSGIGDELAAAVLARTKHGNLHVGLLYTTHAGEQRVLHLGWEDRLADQWDEGGVWLAPKVEPERLISLAQRCRRVWLRYRKVREFPYALRLSNTTFDANGRLVLGEGARGLTCATFVLAVFRSIGIELVDFDGWPIRKALDREFLDRASGFAEAEHLRILTAEVDAGVKRCHPDEAAAACLEEEPPNVFETIRPTAEALSALLD